MRSARWIAALFLLLLAAGCGSDQDNRPIITGDALVSSSDGLIIVTAGSDAQNAAADTVIPTFSNVMLKDTQGKWHDIGVDYSRFNIMGQDRKQRLLAQGKVPAGSYSHLRVQLASVSMRTVKGETQAILPGNSMTFALPIRIKPGKTTLVTLQFSTKDSIRTTREDKLVFAPVVTAKARTDANVNVDSQRGLLSSGGTLTATILAGMDEAGDFGPGRMIPKEATLTLIGDKVRIVGLITDLPRLSRYRKDLPKNVTVNIVLRKGSMNPNRIEVRQEQRLTLVLRSHEVPFGVEIADLGLKRLVEPGIESVMKIESDKRGAFDVRCIEPCYGKEGQVLGKVLIR